MAYIMRAGHAQAIGLRSPPPNAAVLLADGRALHFSKAGPEHADSIVALINGSRTKGGEVLEVKREDVLDWIRNGNSYIVIDPATNEIVSHNAVTTWPGCFELRAAITKSDYQGSGINIKIKTHIIDSIFASNPNAIIISIKNGSNGLNSLSKSGFIEEELDSAREKYGFTILKPDEGPWHIYVLTNPAYLAAQLKQARRTLGNCAETAEQV